MQSPLKISIITPCLNRASFIADAIESVIAQDYPNYEHIIIDGGSTDGTLEKLQVYPHLKVITSNDNGMYEALNKGLTVACGDIIGFLNSDDLYTIGSFSIVRNWYERTDSMVFFGGAETFSKDKNGVVSTIDRLTPSNQTILELATIGSPCFNAWFFKKDVFEQIGTFNTSYKIVSDRDFVLRIALAGLKYKNTNEILYEYRIHSDSLTFDITDKKFDRILKEHVSLTKIYLGTYNLSKKEKLLINQIPAQNTIGMMIWCLQRGNIRKALVYGFIGIKYDRFWLQKVFRITLGVFLNRNLSSNLLSGFHK